MVVNLNSDIAVDMVLPQHHPTCFDALVLVIFEGMLCLLLHIVTELTLVRNLFRFRTAKLNLGLGLQQR